MHTGRYYTAIEIFFWTLRETIVFVLVAALPTIAWAGFGQSWLSIPWQPVALVGTAVAFVTGFKNNAAYGRLWEARTIWGHREHQSHVGCAGARHGDQLRRSETRARVSPHRVAHGVAFSTS